MSETSTWSTLIGAPPALLRAGKASWKALAVWGVLAALICFLLAELLVRGLEPAQEWLLSRYLPERFMSAGRWALETIAGEQLRATLVSSAVTGSMLLVSALLFILKERASAIFETESGAAVGRQGKEAPLWQIALEELWLIVLYAALSMASFWIGYGGAPWRHMLAAGLTHALLGFTLAADYIAPAMQRHGWKYPQIVRCIWHRPGLSVVFGLLFGAPVLVAVHLFGKPLPVEVERSITIIAVTQLLCLATAIWVGTWVGARLAIAEDPKLAPGLPKAVHAATLTVVTFSAVTFGSLIHSAYQALPLLKCHYRLVPGGWEVDLAGFGAELELALEIENPTPWDAKIGPNRLELAHGGSMLLATALPEAAISAGAKQRHSITVPIELEGGLAKKGLSTLWTIKQEGLKAAAKDAIGGIGQIDEYDLTLYLETPWMDFPVYLQRSAAAKAGKR
jgi:hypothetical protein